MSIQDRAVKVLAEAQALAAKATSWTEFSNDVFGQSNSVVARVFPRMTERQAFYEMPQYERCNDLLLALIKKYGVEQGASSRKSGKFVVRVPRTLHARLEVEASQEGVSLNQLAVSKLSVRMDDAMDLTRSLIAEAYRHVYDGYSSDRVIVHPKLNEAFLQECRRLGLTCSDYDLNHLLQDIRKSQPALLPPATKKPLITDYDEFLFASEIAFRHLQRKEGVTLDRVLCDPILRARFDDTAMRLSKITDVFKLRMGALYLRKTHRLTRETVTAPKYSLRRAGTIKQLKLRDIPESPGMYVFYEDARPIYAGETAKLRHRIQLHVETSESLFLPRWLELGSEASLELRFYAVRKASSRERLLWLNQFINQERPALNYQAAA
jgi:site-specific DNA-methyltransferase (adenine-specific)